MRYLVVTYNLKKLDGKLLVFILALSACKVPYENLPGVYEMKNFPKTTLTLKKDGSFIFTQNYLNPYLHPFEHPDEYYFKTAGRWDAVPGVIRLKGTTDSLDYERVKIISSEPASVEKSNFKFFDEHGDLVPILFVKYNDSTTIAALHRSMKEFDVDLTKRDTLKFYFFGYEPWTLIDKQSVNKEYRIELRPLFRPNAIDSLFLKSRKNSLGTGKLKFIKNRE